MHSWALFQPVKCAWDVPTHATPRAAEEGANVCPGEAAEGSENTGTGALLEGESAAGTDADGLAC